MKAAILETINSPLVVDDVELTELTFGQVLVKVLVSGICGSQLHEIAGNKGNAKFVPHLLGHEGAGIVEAIGPGVSKVKQGDKVIMHWRKGEGIEADFPTYIWKGKKMRSGKVTTLSEYSVVSENRVTPVPHDTPNELCALLGCSLSTALGLIDNESDLKLGESFMTMGVGGLGVNLIKAARLAGAHPIVAVDIHDHKRATALEVGADLYINAATQSLRDELEKNLGLKDIHVIVDCTGSKKAIEDSLQLLSGIGRFVMLGHPKPGESIEIRNANHFFEGEGKLLRATQGGRFSPTRDIPRYVALHKKGRLNIDKIITHRYKLHEINEAIDQVRKGNASRILIEMQ